MPLRDYLQLEDERPYLNAAYDDRLDDEQRIAYAAIVERRDPDRAEWLRLEVELHAHATPDPDRIARFVALARQIGFDYANVLTRKTILNCGKGKDESPRVRFAFACPKRWQTLMPTTDDAVRHCQHCNELVYYCEDVAAATRRAHAGQCIAIAKELSNGGVDEAVLGRPDPVGMWADRLFPR
ncbi:MAG TPA: hypothetical protein VG755_20470 [Nannocystaceae bacterium]|nr:hypothetical protein [Nannocystaceae bacterium]